jgi:outer membrane protein OmpA-like peptidoglycan-associated protein
MTMIFITKIGERGDSPLIPQFLAASCMIMVLACGTAMAAAPQQLTPQAGRISDAKISKDRKTFESMQRRIQALNAAGVPVSNYHLAKTQAYLDVALDEYQENDRSSFVDLALAEADGLLRGLESGAKELTLATYPLDLEKNAKAGSAAARTPENRLRPDLWAVAESMKRSEHFSCAAVPTAQLEVELLQAIHEDRIGGWRRTSPYVAIAENLSARAQESLEDCEAIAKAAAIPVTIAKAPEPAPVSVAAAVPVPPAPVAVAAPVVAAVVPPPPPPVPAVTIVDKRETLIILSEHVYFAFGRANISDAGKIRMREVASILNAPDARDRKILINGYTDDVGNSRTNLTLSERRAEAVRRALIDNGIDASRLTARGFGGANPAAANRHPNGTDDPEARAQNRRVELVLEAK